MAYLVTGRTDTGDTYPRLEVRELEKKPEQWALFILGLRALYEGTHTVPPFPEFPNVPPAVRWANIGAIHGKPYEPWIGDPKSNLAQTHIQDVPKQGEKDFGGAFSVIPSCGYKRTYSKRIPGYCNHISVLFPTWHRPVVLLAEQAIGNVATYLASRIATQFPSSGEKWTHAAKELRFPFWDWLDPRTETEGLPQILQKDIISIRAPGADRQVSLDNPLKTYPISKALREQLPCDFQKYERTMRHPTSTTEEDYEGLNKALRDKYAILKYKIDQLFTFPLNLPSEEWARAWDEFSNVSPQSRLAVTLPDPPAQTSVEATHGSVHVIVGGKGHMGDTNVAGFDPIFYLHHAFVDNLLYRWMTKYPNYWMGKGWQRPGSATVTTFQQPGATFPYIPLPDEKAGYDINEASDLTPFGISQSKYWTSKDAKELPYYTYPSQPANQLLVFNPKRDVDFLLKHSKSALFDLNGQKSPSHLDPPNGYTRVANYLHFILSVQLLEHAFNGSYTLSLYSQTTGELLGFADVFTRRDITACENCQRRREGGNVVYDAIHFSSSLAGKILAGGKWESLKIPAQYERLKGDITAVLTRAGGERLAHAVGVNPPVGQDTDPMDADKIPKLTLHTASACYPDGHMGGPFSFYDWQGHGEVFGELQWLKG